MPGARACPTSEGNAGGSPPHTLSHPSALGSSLASEESWGCLALRRLGVGRETLRVSREPETEPKSLGCQASRASMFSKP